MAYSKNIKLGFIKDRDLENIERGIELMGFDSTEYGVVHFGINREIIVRSKELYWILKSMSKMYRVNKNGKY